MEYTIRQLAELTGISTRTLRYYDEISLLPPSRVNDSGYRYYGEKEINLLQQILFYRERDLSLEVIGKVIHQPDFDVEKALEEHLEVLSRQQERILSLIQTVKLTLADLKGEYKMDDKMKFEAFKKNAVEENEKTYGKEARGKYGDEAVDESNRKLLGMTEADYERFKDLEQEVLCQLEGAVENGISPESETGQRIVLLHKNWLSFTWKQYSAQAHKGLAEMYLADERFQAYYDRNVAGCAKFLVEAVRYWA